MALCECSSGLPGGRRIVLSGGFAEHFGRMQEGGTAMIKKVAGGYQVLSSKGKNLGGPYKTRKEAEKRLRQVEFFKHKKG